MASSPLQILITRPQPENQTTQEFLRNQGWSVYGTPAISIVPDLQMSATTLHTTLRRYDTIIAVSYRAVSLCETRLNTNAWPRLNYFAVGAKSASVWRYSGLTVQVPSESSSERLLELLLAQKSPLSRVLILRGHSGREWLAEQLQNNGFSVDYLDCYHRTPIVIEPEQLMNWPKQGINTIVCSSGAVFDALHNQTPHSPFHTWLKTCNLLLPSQRVCQQASALGYTNTWNCHGAADTSVHQMLNKLAHRLKES